MIRLKVRRFGRSLAVTLSAEAARALKVSEGYQLLLTEAPGGFRITPYDPDFSEVLKAAESFMGRYKNALRELGR